ncbi:hypothetical+protein [Methylocapsa aurea]
MSGMDKSAPWAKRGSRFLIAGLLAWALVIQSMAAVASARWNAVDGDVVSADFARCAADSDASDHRHSPERHISCSCCIPGRSDPLGGLPDLAAALPDSIEVSFPIAGARPVDYLLIGNSASPPGWITSWSQRAPPRLS